MPNLSAWFEKGLSKNEYIRAMEVHKDNLLNVYNHFELPDEEKKQLWELQDKGLKAVIITADWCGDAMVNLPILMRIADEALIETRYLIRDENLELMDQYLTNGKSRSIPIVIFLNESNQEIGKWGPRAPEVQKLVEQIKNEKRIPEDKNAPGYEEAFKAFVKEMTTMFRENQDIWGLIKEDLCTELNNAVEEN
ncbi:thioredoxin family protein [Alkalihalobacillus trypoxylicola]|uniref:Thioredoxin n=1 Tax=Alkalihalobacillus trypoxylicola TaxID=519424 RepID=A0A161PF94_9BACI|nr:thioredoxin family protein [Alkalihalobacillus trypoxylicola]KYG27070.1 thioredoxin [Alkalihalobacillus trypoxylicola]